MTDAPSPEQLKQLIAQQKQLTVLYASRSWRLTAPLRLFGRIAKRLLRQPLAAPAPIAPTLKNYAGWIRQFDSPNSEVSANLMAQIDTFAHLPLFSILLPIQNATEEGVSRTVTSVQKQIYPHWELCIAVGLNASAEIKTLISDLALKDARIKLTSSLVEGNLADLSNQALTMVSPHSDWIFKITATNIIAKYAIYTPAREINIQKNSQIIYSDEDSLDAQGHRCNPYFKPDWNLDLHLSHDLIGHFGMYRTSLVQQVGGYQIDMAKTMDFDLSLRCVAQVTYTQIVHLPYVLFHREAADFAETDAAGSGYMMQRWDEALRQEPAYSPNLTLVEKDFCLAWPPRVPPLMRDVEAQPGQAPLHQRLAQLVKDAKRVAYFAENVHSSTFRYRAANMAEVLNTAGTDNKQDTSAACFFSSDLQYAADIVESADMLVISRARYDLDIAQLIQQFKTQRKKVWFDIDDWVFDAHQIDLIISSQGQYPSDEILNYWHAVVSRMARTMRLCDGVITTNSFLANKASKFIDLPVKIIPNFANAKQLEVSKPIYERKLVHSINANEKIKLGYFSGSASHNCDLAMILPALKSVMLRDPRVELVLVGPVELGAGFEAQFGSRVARHDFTDFVTLQKLIGAVAFNLVPLLANEFTDCKSELKFVDAALVGTLTIASPAFAYAEAVRHGENGYLAHDDQWEAVLLQAIATRDSDHEKHRRMTAAANQDVQQRFTWQTQRPAILQALELR